MTINTHALFLYKYLFIILPFHSTLLLSTITYQYSYLIIFPTYFLCWNISVSLIFHFVLKESRAIFSFPDHQSYHHHDFDGLILK